MSGIIEYQRRVATPEEWDAHRETIAELYQRRKLREVMKHMEDEHQFFATVKMYKSRFERWGLQKNFRSKQVRELLLQKRERDAAGKATTMYIRGKRVDTEKLQTYLNRTSKHNQDQILTAASGGRLSLAAHRLLAPVVVCRTPSPVPSSEQRYEAASQRQVPSDDEERDGAKAVAHSGVPRRTYFPTGTWPSLLLLSTPDALKRAEKCMHCLQTYVTNSFHTGRWNDELDYDSELDQLLNWSNLFTAASEFLAQGRNQQGFRLLRLCFANYRNLLSDGSFVLFSGTYDILCYFRFYPDLLKSFKRHAYKLSQIVHGASHPFSILLREIHDMDYAEIESNWKPLAEYYHDFLMSNIRDESDLMFEVVRVRHETMLYQYYDGLLQFEVAESALRKDIAAWERYTHSSSPQTSGLKWSLANLYFFHGRFDEARQIVSEVLEHGHDSGCLAILSSIAAEQGSVQEAIDLCKIRINYCNDVFGPGDEETVCAVADFESILRVIGEEAMADTVLEQIDRGLEQLCIRYGEMELHAVEDEVETSNGCSRNETRMAASVADDGLSLNSCDFSFDGNMNSRSHSGPNASDPLDLFLFNDIQQGSAAMSMLEEAQMPALDFATHGKSVDGGDLIGDVAIGAASCSWPSPVGASSMSSSNFPSVGISISSAISSFPAITSSRVSISVAASPVSPPGCSNLVTNGDFSGCLDGWGRTSEDYMGVASTGDTCALYGGDCGILQVDDGGFAQISHLPSALPAGTDSLSSGTSAFQSESTDTQLSVAVAGLPDAV